MATARAATRRRGGVEERSLGVVAILMSDVELSVRLNGALEQEGIQTVMISPMDDVRGELRRSRPGLLVMTAGLLDANNVALVRQQLWDGVAVLGIADSLDEDAEARLRDAGYTQVWPRTVSVDDLLEGVTRRLERQWLVSLTGLVGESEAISQVLVQIQQIAPVSSTVLIEGESGTGKELVARAIHSLGSRRGRPFIAVNVGALASTLLESELFGHEKGSFTGASERRLGRFELADTGTLFLDEIGEIPQATQVKLLRVLEEREVTRVGGSAAIPVDVRVVAATNRPLQEHVANGSFRADLYYRLNVLRIYLPPLRDRREDIPILLRRFVGEFFKLHDRAFNGISAAAMRLLVDYPWPGNVRELRNLVESMVVLAHGREIGAEDIPRSIRDAGAGRLLPVHVGPIVRQGEQVQGHELEFIVRSLVELKLQVESLRRRLDEAEHVSSLPWVEEARFGDAEDGESLRRRVLSRTSDDVMGQEGVREAVGVSGAIEAPHLAPPPSTITLSPGMTMAEIERLAIEGALRDSAGNRRKAAELLGIGERTLYRKLRDYELGEELATEK